MESRRPDGESVWDATMDITRVTPSDAQARWTSLTVVIKAVDGSVLLLETPLSKDSGTYGSAVEAWYVDDAGGRGTADVGDAVKVTSMDQSYQGATVQLIHRGTLAGSVLLPIAFT
jgi:hypothetical protein